MSFDGSVWRIRLLDGPVLEAGTGLVVSRFRSKKVASLLAYLALRLGRRCPREEIACALWPDETDEQVLSNRLRFTLASLRKQLEPDGVPFGSVLDASIPGCIRLREETVWCDVAEFDQALRDGRETTAADLLRGPLMPGYYDEWLRTEQIRFELALADRSEVVAKAGESKLAVSPPAASRPRLPLYLTKFFGREAELSEVPAAVMDRRLVTLTGPGGIGKTRLAVESMNLVPMTSAFAALAELNDPTRIGEVVLGALGIESRRDAPFVEQLASVLAEKPPLALILDNVEHLVEDVAEFAVRLLEAAPTLHLIVTSRHRLEVPGEIVFALKPLGSPSHSDDVARMSTHPSVALFLDRARTVRPDFAMSGKISEAIADICERLEGVPLALELAAVRITAQSPAQIADGLSANLMDLKSRQRGLSERHRSLRAAVQGSYDLLGSELQHFFRSLAVFEAGWTATAAEAVVGDARAREFLEELVVRSLASVSAPTPEATPRYRFLETLRQFAREQLGESELDQLRDSHSTYFLELAAHVTEDDIRSFLPLDGEQENLIAAITRGEAEGRPLFWRGLGGALTHAFVRGRHRIALRWIDAYGDRFTEAEDPSARLQLRYAACQILPDVGRLEQTQSMALEMEADSLARGNEQGAIYAQVVKGYVAEFSGNLDSAVELHRDAVRRAKGLENRHLMETCLSHASGTLHDAAVLLPSGDSARREMLLESEILAHELRRIVPSYSRRKPLAPLLLATGLRFQGRKAEALAFYHEAEQNAIEIGTTTELMYAFVFESEITMELGDDERAARLFGAFRSLQERMGYSIERAQYIRPTWISNLDAALRKSLGDFRYDSLLRDGREAKPGDLVGKLS